MRIDFAQAVKETVAARNGFRCSFPGCDVTTLGPGALTRETVSTGVAAHIYSASPGGPRGQAVLTPLELQNIENAIWLCANHGRIVDANRGAEFPATRLRSFKAAHEALISFEQRGTCCGFGWLQSLTVEKSPVFVPDSRLDFSRPTVIFGETASGKTALCEWLAGCGEISFLKRWSRIGKDGERTQVRFDAVNPLPFTWRVRVYGQSNIQFEVDGLPVPRLDIPHGFVHAPERPSRYRIESETTSAYLARWLRVDVAHVHNVVRSIASRGGHHVHNPRFLERDGRETLLVDVDGTKPGLDFEHLSNTEQCSVVIELAVELARFEIEHRPTMLLVDCMASFDRRLFQDYLEFVAAHTGSFQALLTAPYEATRPVALSIDSLHVAHLRGREKNVHIE